MHHRPHSDLHTFHDECSRRPVSVIYEGGERNLFLYFHHEQQQQRQRRHHNSKLDYFFGLMVTANSVAALI